MTWMTEGGIRAASGLVPMVIEQTSRGERSYDIYSRLFSYWVRLKTTWLI